MLVEGGKRCFHYSAQGYGQAAHSLFAAYSSYKSNWAPSSSIQFERFNKSALPFHESNTS